MTKSVSRFARNTVDSLTTIRKLKEAGCECFFQKENIMTFDSKGELLITIMSSLAQEESRSISENVTWGQRKRFSDGKVSIPYGQFLGYRKGADGLPEIVPEEAEIVKRIYREFLQGKSTNAIATMLTEECIPTPGKKTVWQRATVESILRNEKYKGSALLQKSFTVDFLTKKTKINEGEVPQYYVDDSHPAIIEPWEWEQVQVELERRKNSRNRHHQTSPFSGKIICADCGDIFGAKTWHSTDRYRRVIWQCNGKFKGEHKCETPHLTEERLKELYLAALGEYLSDRDAAIDQLRYAQRMLTDTDFIDADIQVLEEELTTITGMLRLCIAENAANTVTEETYRATHAELCNRFEETEAKLAALQKQRDKMKADAIIIGGMMFELGELDGKFFDEILVDAKEAELLKATLIPKYRDASSNIENENAYGIFIGYSFSPTEFEGCTPKENINRKVQQDIENVKTQIVTLIESMPEVDSDYYIFFLPFNDAIKDKHSIMQQIAGVTVNESK